MDNPNQEHDVADLAKELDNVSEDRLDDLAEVGDEGPTDTRCPAKKKTTGSVDDMSDDESDIEFSANGINHGDLFSKNKGGAQIAQGDDDFDEEMGGQSQIVEVATKIACEGMASEGENEDEENNGDEDGQDGENEEVEIDKHITTLANIADGVDVGNSDRTNTGLHANESSNCTVWNALPRSGVSDADMRVNSPEQMKPASSEKRFQDYSPCSLDGLRTQPTQTQTPTQKGPVIKRGAMPKVTLMGTVFEATKKKEPHTATKQATDLYIPSYSRRK